MRNGQTSAGRRRLVILAMIAPLALAVFGCGGGPKQRVRRMAATRVLGPTIGRNLGAESPGQTIPAAGLGVDLVERPSARTSIDGAVGAASLIPPGQSK